MKMKADLEAFVLNGTFGTLQLGMHRAEMEALLGKPHFWGGTLNCTPEQPTYEQVPIWGYDHFEFHFGCSDRLFLMYCDHLNLLKTRGKTLTLNLWLWKGRPHLSRAAFLQHLTESDIPYTETFNAYTGTIRCAGNVECVYDLGEDDTIVTLSYMDRDYW